MTEQSHSKFFEINELLLQAVMTNMDIALIDMPEILLRMKIAHNHSLAELQEMFNFIMNKLARQEGPCSSTDTAALYYFPEVFQKPRDEYVAAMIKEIAMHSGEQNEGMSAMSCYLGNVHVAPITRMLKTYNSDGIHSVDYEEKRGRKLKTKNASVKKEFIFDYIKISQMRYNVSEPAEEKIAKQALLEALFGTQLWNEPYITNPFIYVTDHDVDFEGEKGAKLKRFWKFQKFQQIDLYEF